jgi:hypothetical protein
MRLLLGSICQRMRCDLRTSAGEPLERVVKHHHVLGKFECSGLVIICFLLALRCKRR